MKQLLLLIFPFLISAQTPKQRKIYLLNKKVDLTIPAELAVMSNEMWKWKYKNMLRSALALQTISGSKL